VFFVGVWGLIFAFRVLKFSETNGKWQKTLVFGILKTPWYSTYSIQNIELLFWCPSKKKKIDAENGNRSVEFCPQKNWLLGWCANAQTKFFTTPSHVPTST
jgi:hypothetical protein